MAHALGIDVGGTSIKLGVCDDAGNVVARSVFSSVEVSSAELVSHIARYALAHDVVSIAFGVPGPVSEQGELLLMPNLDLDIDACAREVRASVDAAPVSLVNDANAAALGEMWQGAAAGARNLVFVTLGTGVGAGVVIDGHVLVGAHGAAGELGHYKSQEAQGASPTCGCGGVGCLELYASARGVVSKYRELCAERGCEPVALAGSSDSQAVFSAARTGDPCAQDAISFAGTHLGRALAQTAVMFDPEVFVIGGGMSAGFSAFKDALVAAYQANAFPAVCDTPIVCASLGNDAGLLGAAYFAFQQVSAR